MNADELVCIRAAARTGPVVLFVPFAGGSAQSYFAWKEFFGPDVALFALELPGRGRCHDRLWPEQVQDLAAGFARRLRDEGLNPDVIFGHSFGALIAFELIREMRRNHAPLPRTAVLSGRIAAMNPVVLPDLSFAQLVNYLRESGGTPDAVLQNRAVLDMAIPVLRGDLEMIERYVYTPEPALATDLILLGGLEDGSVPVEGLMDWRREFSGAFDLRMYPGGHFFIEKQRQAIALLVQRLLPPAPAGRPVDVR